MVGNQFLALLSLEQKIFEIEKKLFDFYQTGARWDDFRNPTRITEHLLAIAKECFTSGADFAPSTQHIQMVENLKTQLKQVVEEYVVC